MLYSYLFIPEEKRQRVYVGTHDEERLSQFLIQLFPASSQSLEIYKSCIKIHQFLLLFINLCTS